MQQKIMIVDDNPDIVDLILGTNYGCAVKVCRNGRTYGDRNRKENI